MPIDPQFADLFNTDDQIANKALNARLAALRRDQSMNSLGIMTGDSALAAEGKTMAGNTEMQQKMAMGVPQARLTAALERARNAESGRHNLAAEGVAAAGQKTQQQQVDNAARHQRAVEAHNRALLEAENWQHIPAKDGMPAYLYNRKTAETRPIGGIPGMEFDPKNPSAGGKLTEPQLKTYEAANRIIDNLGVLGTGGPTGIGGRKDLAATGLGGGPAAWVVPQEAASEGGRLYFDAARNVIGGLLRKESGAAISADEWNQLGPNYVPMPWDTEESRKAKLQRLHSTLNALIVQAGPGGPALRKRAQELYGAAVLGEPGAVPTGSTAEYQSGVTPGAHIPGAPMPTGVPGMATNPRHAQFGYDPNNPRRKSP